LPAFAAEVRLIVLTRLTGEQRARIQSALGVGLLHALLAYVFLIGLGFDLPRPGEERLEVFDVIAEEPPPPSVPPPPEKVAKSQRERPRDPEGAASPPNLKDTPTEIVAPPPEIRIPVPPPIAAAPIAGQGNAPAAGAAEVPGPGTGRGGTGTGLGSGTYGNGTGGGGGGAGRGARARWLSGRIYDDDYPEREYRARIGGTVHLRFVVAPSGRVSDCRVTRSSGSAGLDATTCRLIRKRFRYRPARDGLGRPVAETVTGEHVWEVGAPPPDVWAEPTIEEVERY
jgi:protein TonB